MGKEIFKDKNLPCFPLKASFQYQFLKKYISLELILMGTELFQAPLLTKNETLSSSVIKFLY